MERLETLLAGCGTAAAGDPTAPPLFQTATFHVDPADPSAGHDYSRSGNPTRDLLEVQLARLEHGSRALAHVSGLAALANLFSLLEPGEELLLGRDLYGGTQRYVEHFVRRAGVRVRTVDPADAPSLDAALAGRPRLLLVETPSNPLQDIVDLERTAAACRRAGTLLAVDNTFLSPVLQNPLTLGADCVVHSATKFLGGHGDLTAGAVIVRDPVLAERLAFHRNAAGTALPPFPSWLLLRGLKTLAVRQAAQQRSARRLAAWLRQRPEVERTLFPGLSEHPGAAIHARQARGPGSVITLELREAATAARLLGGTRRFATTVSFGSVTSSIEAPALMSHASVPEDAPAQARLGDRLVRLSIGLEHCGDLQADLERAFDDRGPDSP